MESLLHFIFYMHLLIIVIFNFNSNFNQENRKYEMRNEMHQ